MVFQLHSLADDVHFPIAQRSRSVAERGKEMFRAEIKQNGNGSLLKMEGRLVGDWANEVRLLVTRGPALKALIVDLTEVSYVDAIGEQLLTWLSNFGAVFIAKAVYIAAVCERLHLPIQHHGARDEMRYRGILVAQEEPH